MLTVSKSNESKKCSCRGWPVGAAFKVFIRHCRYVLAARCNRSTTNKDNVQMY